jgi:hypothetical protein
MRGLDPRIHPVIDKMMDCRVTLLRSGPAMTKS